MPEWVQDELPFESSFAQESSALSSAAMTLRSIDNLMTRLRGEVRNLEHYLAEARRSSA